MVLELILLWWLWSKLYAGIRSLRGALATGNFIAGMGEQVSVHRHQLEAKVKIAGSPKCRVLIYTPPDDDFDENTGVLVHFVRLCFALSSPSCRSWLIALSLGMTALLMGTMTVAPSESTAWRRLVNVSEHRY